MNTLLCWWSEFKPSHNVFLMYEIPPGCLRCTYIKSSAPLSVFPALSHTQQEMKQNKRRPPPNWVCAHPEPPTRDTGADLEVRVSSSAQLDSQPPPSSSRVLRMVT